jgi:hypothetical protein
MPKSLPILAAVAAVILCIGLPASAKSIKEVAGFEPHFVLPPDSGMADIKKDFGAVGDGKTDDTAAFRKAIGQDAPRAIYIPNGTYLIKEQLRFGVDAGKKKRVLLIGESASGTILKLVDNAPGFGDPKKPMAFLHTIHPKQQFEQNMANYIYHLTIEIGKGNAGAQALIFHSNNTGGLRDIVIRASDPVGSPGLQGIGMAGGCGPALGRYITVDGFKTGISTKGAGNYFTMEHITVRNCEVGVDGQTTTLRGLVADKCGVAFAAGGNTVLIDAVITGSGDAAITANKCGLFARNIKTTGYKSAIASDKGNVAGPNVAEWTSSPVVHNFDPAAGCATSLNLPVEESPELQYPQNASEWMMVKGGDITESLQKAIDDGAVNIYVSPGASINKTIILRNKVQRIMSLGVSMITMKTPGAPVFRLEGGDAKVVLLELMYTNYGSNSAVGVEQASPRTLVVRHGSLSYRTDEKGCGGKVFMESICSHVDITKVKAWLRDMDTEAGGPDAHNLSNNGGVMWVLGQKTEDFATKLTTVNGGYSELLGGTFRQNWDKSDFDRTKLDMNNPPPLFEVVDSAFSATYVSWGPAVPFKSLVREKRGGETRDLDRAKNGGGAVLFVGYAKPYTDAAKAGAK